ncbi:MAG: hypothetical protein K9W43_04870 [Candidatus Thorarchaeota archaeon]|nr:hypothetical protein [Candidatus Thorarchaeota archaeon]
MSPYPLERDTPRYEAVVNAARSYLRRRDFLTYATQLVPEPIGSESWSLAWGYMRRFDDMLDSGAINKTQAMNLLESEKVIVDRFFSGDHAVRVDAAPRHKWLAQFFANEEKYYEGRALKVVKDLYESAWGDVLRRGVILTSKEMNELLYKKARSFFKLYFILSGFDLGGYIDDFSYLFGMGLGMLDDILDLAEDYEANYVNITREEMEALGLDLEPDDQDFLKRIVDAGYLTYKSKKILSLLIKARQLSRQVRSRYVRSFLLRLSEVFAGPILEERFIPGQKYFFRGGSLANMILPKNESLAYKIGHRLMSVFLRYPQLSSYLFESVSSKRL